jgi:hypothetical protein
VLGGEGMSRFYRSHRGRHGDGVAPVVGVGVAVGAAAVGLDFWHDETKTTAIKKTTNKAIIFFMITLFK